MLNCRFTFGKRRLPKQRWQETECPAGCLKWSTTIHCCWPVIEWSRSLQNQRANLFLLEQKPKITDKMLSIKQQKKKKKYLIAWYTCLGGSPLSLATTIKWTTVEFKAVGSLKLILPSSLMLKALRHIIPIPIEKMNKKQIIFSPEKICIFTWLPIPWVEKRFYPLRRHPPHELDQLKNQQAEWNR